MVSLTLSHYRILGELGTGGMGAVYHALDTDLGRPVAIKFLRPEFARQPDRQERFLREARATAALSHPNICTIHEIGRTGDDLFIVMQLVEGRTLSAAIASGPLGADRLSMIALQLADALAEAHRHGILHRDVKPSNIMLGEDDSVTVLDFGLAAVASESRAMDDESTATNRPSPLTLSGQALGTCGYMSPEQIRGEHVDAATDVFSAGVTLYEAATGRNPFVRSTPLQTMAAVLGDNPPPIRSTVGDFPASLDDIVLKCLHKRPELRFADGSAIAEALRHARGVERTLSAGRTRHRSLAVLPFTNLHGHADDEYLADGMATEIITKLARLKGLLVISPTATLPFRKSSLSGHQIGRELNVQAVLEGTVVRRDRGFRVSVQLSDVENGFCVWTGQFDFTLHDFFRIQEVVAGRVARALRARLSNGETALPDPGSTNPEALKLYLRGKTFYYRFNSTDNLLAIEAFRSALKSDPRCAPADAGLASACMARLEREWESDESAWIAEALAACDRATAQDPWLSEAYSARGLVFVRQGRLAEAEAELRRALAINANDDIAHSMLGRIWFERGDLRLAARAFKRALKITPDYVWCWNDLAWVQWLLGRFEETERALSRVLAINPLDEIARVGIATGHYFRGELDAAIAVARKSIEINPQHPFSRPVLAVALARQQRITEAVEICTQALDERPNDFLASAALGVVYALAGDVENLRLANGRALAITATRNPLNLNVAVHYAFLDRPDYARLWIGKAIKEGLSSTIVLDHNPLLKPFAPEFGDNSVRSRRQIDGRASTVSHAGYDH